MANDDLYFRILEKVRDKVRALNLQDIPLDRIYEGMLPETQQQIRMLPAIIIAPYGDNATPGTSGDGSMWGKYPVEICVVDVNNFDFRTNLRKYQEWQRKARNAILLDGNGEPYPLLPGVPEVWDINEVKSPTFDRSKLNQAYAYLSQVIEFQTHE